MTGLYPGDRLARDGTGRILPRFRTSSSGYRTMWGFRRGREVRASGAWSRHHQTMETVHFHTLRTAVQTNASARRGATLAALENILRQRLMSSGLFDTVEVEHTDDVDQLVVSICQYRASLSEDAVAGALETLWTDQVADPFWEAHAVRVDDGFVELEAASRESRDGHYVTLHLVAEKSVVPSQRRAYG